MVYFTINDQVSEMEEGAMLWYSKACFRVRKHGIHHPNLVITCEMDHLALPTAGQSHRWVTVLTSSSPAASRLNRLASERILYAGRHSPLGRLCQIEERFGESSSRTFSTIFFACVRAQSEPSGLEKASIQLQVVILEWLGTADKLAVHLALVSQVDQLP